MSARGSRAAVREGDTVARLGGDEFAVLCPGLPTLRWRRSSPQRLVDALAEPFGLEQISLHVGASVGIALLPEHADDVEPLVQRADIAHVRGQGGRGVDPTLRPEARLQHRRSGWR